MLAAEAKTNCVSTNNGAAVNPRNHDRTGLNQIAEVAIDNVPYGGTTDLVGGNAQPKLTAVI